MAIWEGKPERMVSKRDACLRQIHGAILMLREQEYECSITLAGAAEGMIDDGGPQAMWDRMMAKVSDDQRKETISNLNAHRDWLKHPKEDDEIDVGEYVAVSFIVRAITKFTGKFTGKTSVPIREFTLWAVEHGYFEKKQLEDLQFRKGFI